MKKLTALTLTLLILMGSLAGCTKPPAASSPGTSPTASPTDSAPEYPNTFGKAPEDIGIVMVINTNLGDKSFCDLSYEGLQRIAEEYGCRIKVVELGGDATKQVPTMVEFAEDPDWDIIIAATYNILEAVQTVAQEFPEQKFIVYDAKDDLGLPNVYCVEHLQNEGSFVVGAAAALLTQSDAPLANDKNVIGFVAGNQNTAIDDFMVGYILGAQYIDPDCKVLVSYIGDFRDTAKGKEMALAQINQGVDVVFAVAGGAGLGVLDAAKEKDVYAIGVDADQANIFADTDPVLTSHIATSMMKRVDNTVYNALSAAIEGTIVWGSYDKAGLASNSVGAAKSDPFGTIFTAEQQAAIADVEAKIANGEIVVETAVGMSNERLSEIRTSAQP